MRTFAIALASVVALGFGGPALATHHGPTSQGVSANAHEMTDGEVRKVDKDAQKITLRHGPMPALDMPSAMTMVYRVKDPAMLDQVKQGDKVKFEAEQVGGAFTITRIELAK